MIISKELTKLDYILISSLLLKNSSRESVCFYNTDFLPAYINNKQYKKFNIMSESEIMLNFFNKLYGNDDNAKIVSDFTLLNELDVCTLIFFNNNLTEINKQNIKDVVSKNKKLHTVYEICFPLELKTTLPAFLLTDCIDNPLFRTKINSLNADLKFSTPQINTLKKITNYTLLFFCLTVYKLNPVFKLNPKVDFVYDGEYVTFFHKKKNIFFCLQGAMAEVFLLCVNNFDIMQVCEMLSTLYDKNEKNILNDINTLLEQLTNEDIIL